MTTNTKGMLALIKRTSDKVSADISASVDPTSRFSSALSGEGYNGGYRDALSDVILVLNRVIPQRNHWWEE